MSVTTARTDDDGEGAIARELLEQRVRTLAYYMWESEGRQAGRADEYYHRARQQLEAETDSAPRERSQKPRHKRKEPL
ncbi:DUF2934 domain-containing protein [Caballeronia sp. Lep1P3]|uniref:DUF2934 domain-containing protein n=1 Tax=Caballeronia sp. Lep1P3 TaxID=2878150 RepID=UPI001FD5CA88|nr:DUF2934 domain-containing protein [Caballeronia sp. Lep1P3]